jgi:hypothetical protein
MPISFACICGKRLRAKDDMAGSTVACPHCKELVVVPVAAALPEIDLEAPSLEARLESLVDQVKALERSNVRLHVVAGMATLGCLISLMVASMNRVPATIIVPDPAPVVVQPPNPTVGGIVEMRGLLIRDEAGRVRATLGYEGDKSAGLKLFDGGKVVSDYKVLGNTDLAGVPSLSFYYSNGVEAFSLGGGGSIDPSMDMLDKDGGPRVQLSLWEGAPNFSLHHSKIRTRFQLGMFGDGRPFMNFFDANDKGLPMLDKAGVPLVLKPR